MTTNCRSARQVGHGRRVLVGSIHRMFPDQCAGQLVERPQRRAPIAPVPVEDQVFRHEQPRGVPTIPEIRQVQALEQRMFLGTPAVGDLPGHFAGVQAVGGDAGPGRFHNRYAVHVDALVGRILYGWPLRESDIGWAVISSGSRRDATYNTRALGIERRAAPVRAAAPPGNGQAALGRRRQEQAARPDALEFLLAPDCRSSGVKSIEVVFVQALHLEGRRPGGKRLRRGGLFAVQRTLPVPAALRWATAVRP